MIRRTPLALCALALALSGCYTRQAIPVDTLPRLSSAPGRVPAAQITGAGCDDCVVDVDRTTPLVLLTRDGARARVTPFDFALSDAQLVSPDDGVLVDRAGIAQASVRQLSLGRTAAMVVLVAGVAIGSFVLIRSQAGADQLGAP